MQADDSLIARGAFTHAAGGLNLTAAGAHIFTGMGLDPALLTAPQTAQKTPLCRDCLDWSARCHHLAGRLGRALLSHILAQGWAKPQPGSRALIFTPQGSAQFDRFFPRHSGALVLDAPAHRT